MQRNLIVSLIVILFVPSLYSAQGDILSTGSYSVSVTRAPERFMTVQGSYTAIDQGDGTYDVDFTASIVAWDGHVPGSWTCRFRHSTNSTPNTGWTGNQMVNAEPDPFIGTMHNMPISENTVIELKWIGTPPQTEDLYIIYIDGGCEDIVLNESITNTSDQVRSYYWEMNEGAGWEPASLDGNAFPTYELQPGQTLQIGLEIDADSNPNCAEFILRSCQTFMGEVQDEECGRVEAHADPSPVTQPPLPDPTDGTAFDYGSGTIADSEAFDDPSFGQDMDDLATREGQQEQIRKAQQIAIWQAQQNFNNTQTIVEALNNTNGGTAADVSGVESRLDTANSQLADIDASLNSIEATLEDDSYDEPIDGPEDMTEGDVVNTQVSEIFTDTDTVLSDVATGLPPAPIFPTTLGQQSQITINWQFKNLPPTVVDLSVWSAEINIFRQIMTWFLYIFMWFTIITIIRGAFAG